ncbi:mCE-family protein [Mycobacterium xenopi 4042]|uniref:MCE-family protein n=1 Tax=Mycobacterium xenopi 4042 TaxID=1299334 RepID=X8DJV6_MYCXE|nr:mCE-family protein [Mycobacterium xenopi 4042]
MRATVIKLSLFWLVLLVFTAAIVVVFGHVRFNRTTGYSAVFTDASGLRPGSSFALPVWRSARSPRWC